MSSKIGLPTVSGVKNSLFDYGYGVAGGLGYALITGFTGSGLIGGAVGAAVAGAMVKGERGVMLATILGFQSIVSTLNTNSNSASSSTGTM